MKPRGLPMHDADTVWNPPHRTRRQRLLDRVQVIGALLIALVLLVAAVLALM